MALDGKFLRLADGASCCVLRMTSLPRGSGASDVRRSDESLRV